MLVKKGHEQALSAGEHTATAQRVGSTLLLTAAILTPPLTGAVIGLTQPVVVSIAPGLSAEGSLQRQNALIVDSGIFGSARLPAIRKNIPFIGNLSASMRANSLVLPHSPGGNPLGLYATVYQNPDVAIKQPFLSKITVNGGIGAGKGAAVDLAAIGVGFALRGRRKHRNEQAFQKIRADDTHEMLLRTQPIASDELMTSWQVVKRTHERKSPKPFNRFVLSLGAVGVVAAGITICNNHLGNEPTTMVETQAVGPQVEQLSPLLKGMTVNGIGMQLALVDAANTLTQYISAVDEGTTKIVANITKAVNNKRQSGQLTFINNPHYTTVAVIADEHCNKPEIDTVLPTIVHEFGVDIVASSGDNDVSRGTTPFENLCVSALKNALQPTKNYPKPVQMVAVGGNHDGEKTSTQLRALSVTGLDGQRVHPIVVLDKTNDFHATIQGLTFVGNSDPRKSNFGDHIQPADPIEQMTLLAKQGHQLADVACRQAEANKVPPTVLAHDPSALYASLAKGCGALNIAGHTHRQVLPTSVTSENNNRSYVFTQGSSSGVGPGEFTEYALPKTAATITLFVYEKASGTPIGYYNNVVQPDLSVKISDFVPLDSSPVVPNTTTKAAAFLQAYDPTFMAKKYLAHIR